jgi:hypothetical protein
MRRVVVLAAALAFALTALPAGAAADDSPADVQPARVQPPRAQGVTRSADIKAAIVDSLKLLGIEHGARITFQEKTRRALGGDFWADYKRSVRWPRQWQDTDSWLVNYIGHPLHGAAAGYVWLDHDPGSNREQFGLSSRYWASRWRSVAWSAAYSVQFEIGPLSEASIGNVGMNPTTTGWVDYVVTPAGGFAILLAEDALDRFLVRWVEARTHNRFYRASMRMLFGPARALANAATSKAPWRRDNRPLDW